MTKLDWNAISAIATAAAAGGTFLAVLVALWPIIAGEVRRRSVARNLRGQLLIQMPAIHKLITRRLPVLSSWGFSREETATVAAMEELYRRADVLNAEEQDLLLALVANLKFLTITDELHIDTAQNLVKLAEDLRNRQEIKQATECWIIDGA